MTPPLEVGPPSSLNSWNITDWKSENLSNLKYHRCTNTAIPPPLDVLTTTQPPPQLVEKFKEATFSMRSNVITTQHANIWFSAQTHTAIVLPNPSFQSLTKNARLKCVPVQCQTFSYLKRIAFDCLKKKMKEESERWHSFDIDHHPNEKSIVREPNMDVSSLCPRTSLTGWDPLDLFILPPTFTSPYTHFEQNQLGDRFGGIPQLLSFGEGWS